MSPSGERASDHGRRVEAGQSPAKSSQLLIAGAIMSNSVQDSDMRLVRGALAAACFLAGLWLMLRELGLLGVVLHEVGRWWPTFLLLAGVAILARSVRLGPHTAVSVVLMCAGCVAFASTRRVLTGRVWTLVAAGGLMAAGMVSVWMRVSTRSDRGASRTGMVGGLFPERRLMP